MNATVYYQETVSEHETNQELLIEEAIIHVARFGSTSNSEDPQPLGLTMQLSCRGGFVVANFTNLEEMFGLANDLNVEHPTAMEGKKVLAYFTGRKLVGLSSLP